MILFTKNLPVVLRLDENFCGKPCFLSLFRSRVPALCLFPWSPYFLEQVSFSTSQDLFANPEHHPAKPHTGYDHVCPAQSHSPFPGWLYHEPEWISEVLHSTS